MKKIGQGLQYAVYDAGDRVVKVPLTRAQIRRRLLRHRPLALLRPAALTARIERMVAARRDALHGLLRRDLLRSDLGGLLLANLRVDEGRITQDKVVPLGRLLRDDHRGRVLIDRYAGLQRACWQRGFAETSYNFTVNHGVDAQGRLVIMDFGELAFRRQDVLQDITDRLWERCWSCQHDLPPGLRAYYVRTMDRLMTAAHVHTFWQDLTPRPGSLATPGKPPGSAAAEVIHELPAGRYK